MNPSRLKRPHLIYMGALCLLGLVTTAGLACGSSRPAAPGPSPTAQAVVAVTGDVQQVAGNRVVVAGAQGRYVVEVAAGAQVDVLRRVEPSAVAVGDWLLIGGIPNPLRTFAITGVVIVPDLLTPPPAADDERLAAVLTRTGIPLFGDGALMEGRPIALGQVQQVEDDGSVTLAGWGDSLRLRITGATSLRRLVPGGPADIQSGGRLAVVGSRQGQGAEAVIVAEKVLVLPP